METQLRKNDVFINLIQDQQSNLEKRRQHQKILHEKRQKEGLARFSEGGDQSTKENAVFRKFESYRKDASLPKNVEDLKVQNFNVDRR